MDKFKEFLTDQLDPDHGLLVKLRSRGALSRGEIDIINAQLTYRERNAKIIEYLSDKNRQSDFIAALREVGQTHIANYLEAEGLYDSQYGTNWPLTKRHLELIDANEESFIDILEVDSGLLGHLLAQSVINRRQKETIESKPTCHKRTETLLDFIRRRSIEDYSKLIEALKATNQFHIAEILTEYGVIIPVHCTLLENTDTIDDDEELISVTLSEVVLDKVQNKSAVQIQRILDNVRLKVVAARQGNSVVIYVYCKMSEDWENVKQLMKSGRLSAVVAMIYECIVPKFKTAKVVTRISGEEEKKVEKFFQGELKFPTGEANATLKNVPFELIDLMLQKSFLHSIRLLSQVKDNGDKEEKDSGDEDIIKRLASVNVIWFRRIIRKRFKRDVWSHLPKCYQRRKGMSALYTYNQQYTEETIQLQSIIRRLKYSDFLSDVECASLKQRTIADNKGTTTAYRHSQFFKIGRQSNETKHNVFIRILRQNNQKMMARFLDNAGDAVRVEIRHSDVADKRGISKQLKTFTDRTQARSSESEMVRNQLRHKDIEIAHSAEDRELVIWMWCKSSDAKDEFEKIQKSRRLNDAFSKLLEVDLRSLKTEHVNVDWDCLQKETVSFPISVSFKTRISLKDDRLVGVTKLGNKIYVLCRADSKTYSSSISTFDDKFPFGLQGNFEFREITFPLDINSNQNENCLYVLDQREKCLWKIMADEGGCGHKIIRWLNFDNGFEVFSISVSRDGQLLVVSRFPSVRLIIYSADGKLSISIKLHREIIEPRHAVLTSSGSFVIFHQFCTRIEINPQIDLETETLGDRRPVKWEKREFPVVSEVSRDGKTIVRRFMPENEYQKFDPSGVECLLSIDPDDRVFVVDTYRHRVILLNSNLKWERILISGNAETNVNGGKCEKKLLRMPRRLFYDEFKKQLIIGGMLSKRRQYVDVYVLSRKLL